MNENPNEKITVKRNIKDCVFTDLFSNKKYLCELYLSLHPEDSQVTEDDLTRTVQPTTSSIHKPASYTVSRCYAAYVYFISEVKGYSTIKIKSTIQ